MTVKAFRLENFMAFTDTDWIELRPITLLFGRNSSGKSAIIRALRLLRQNLGKPGDYTLRFTSEFGVDLGGYKETVHSKNTDLLMRFHFRCAVPEASDKVRQEINQWRAQNNLPAIVASKDDTLSLALTFAYDPHREAELIGIDLSCNWQITNQPDSHTLLSALWLDQETRYEVGYEWRLDTDVPSWLDEDWLRTTFGFPNCFLPEIIGSPVSVLNTAFDGVADSIATFLEGVEYIGPIRPEPQRVYLLDETQRERLRRQGYEAFLDFLEGNKLDEKKEEKIDRWLELLGLGEKVSPRAYRSDQSFTASSINIEEKQKKFSVNLKDTGFGASQVIPIIIQSVTARQRVADKTSVYTIIEQPELHLHPRAQAQLADLFVEEIHTITSGLENSTEQELTQIEYQRSQVYFLLETHSEHLLLHLMLRLAEASLDARKKRLSYKPALFLDDLSLLYVERNPEKGVSVCLPIIVNELGEYVQQPSGFVEFFGEDFDELLTIGQIRAEWYGLGRENDSSL